MNNVYILLEIARWDRTGEILQLLIYASKALYTFLKANRGVLRRLRDSWLTVTVKSDVVVVYRNWLGKIHRRDGPAVSCPVRGDYWLCDGLPHRGDGLPVHTHPLDFTRELTDCYSIWFWKGSIFYTRPDFRVHDDMRIALVGCRYGFFAWRYPRRPTTSNFFVWWHEYCAKAFIDRGEKNYSLGMQNQYSDIRMAHLQRAFEVDLPGRRDKSTARAYQPPKPHWMTTHQPRSPAYLGGMTGRMRRR